MLHAGLDLSRRKVDVCLLSGDGEHLASSRPARCRFAENARPSHRRAPRPAGLRRRRVDDRRPPRPRHARAGGWSVEIADAQKVKGLAPLACKTDKIDSRVQRSVSSIGDEP